MGERGEQSKRASIQKSDPSSPWKEVFKLMGRHAIILLIVMVVRSSLMDERIQNYI